ncbi:MAG: tripartite tricarboxylate transporter substrate binding protein, partial [Alphaproteobacteria bacterium]|nr:tripartite tricarboxylate transporter substrate binding protein [Alphaproteobacteria bacterium]
MLTSILKRTALTAVALAALSTAALAQLPELKIMAPAAPGGGWDGTARSMQQALTGAGIVKSVQVNNVTGAGGTIGLAQLIGAKGDGHQLMVNGFVMVGALLTNKSAVSLSQATPIARLTEEVEVIVVPAGSSIRTAQDLAAA